MNIRDHKTALDRKVALEKETGVLLSNIGSFSLDEDAASSRNCENMIGAAQVPLGVAGPLRLKTKDVRHKREEKYYIPLATTEGALVASVNRGCKAITESGGAMVDSHRVGATRGPVFKVKNLAESDLLYKYLKTHLGDLQKIASQTSRHVTLEKLLTRGVGRYRFVRFVFDTQDAMGMNMVTIASQAMAAYIEQKTGVTCLSLAGNFDIDKKPAWLNFIENRGTKAWAEATIPVNVLKNVLKTTAQRVFDVWLAKCMIGSAISGSMGFNAQYANVAAAIFLATGQDLGHVGEASMGITTTEIIDGKDLYVNVCLPDLMVGTVGGGTGLATQKEALSILGVSGGNDGKNAQKFAEIIAGAVLAGEISLLASLSEGTLAKAHKTLARGGK
ncbi:MAG: hydroxymethylglutaryl-CoA reductase [Patescibacteria group bacterium]